MSLLLMKSAVSGCQEFTGNASDDGFVPQLEEARADWPYPRLVGLSESYLGTAVIRRRTHVPHPTGRHRSVETPDREVGCVRPEQTLCFAPKRPQLRSQHSRRYGCPTTWALSAQERWAWAIRLRAQCPRSGDLTAGLPRCGRGTGPAP